MAPELANAAVKACIESMSELLEEAASLGRATKACTEAGNVDAAFKLMLDIEPRYMRRTTSSKRRARSAAKDALSNSHP